MRPTALELWAIGQPFDRVGRRCCCLLCTPAATSDCSSVILATPAPPPRISAPPRFGGEEQARAAWGQACERRATSAALRTTHVRAPTPPLSYTALPTADTPHTRTALASPSRISDRRAHPPLPTSAASAMGGGARTPPGPNRREKEGSEAPQRTRARAADSCVSLCAVVRRWNQRRWISSSLSLRRPC